MDNLCNLLGEKIVDIYYDGKNIVVRYEDGNSKTVPYDEKSYNKYLGLIHNQNKDEMDRSNKKILKYTKLLILSVALMSTLPFVGYYIGGFVVSAISIGFSFTFFIKVMDALQGSLKESQKQDNIIKKTLEFIINPVKSKINGINHISQLVKKNYPQYAQNNFVISNFAESYYDSEGLGDDDDIISLFGEFIIQYKEDSEKIDHICDDDNLAIVGNKYNLPKLIIDEPREQSDKGMVLEFKKKK